MYIDDESIRKVQKMVKGEDKKEKEKEEVIEILMDYKKSGGALSKKDVVWLCDTYATADRKERVLHSGDDGESESIIVDMPVEEPMKEDEAVRVIIEDVEMTKEHCQHLIDILEKRKEEEETKNDVMEIEAPSGKTFTIREHSVKRLVNAVVRYGEESRREGMLGCGCCNLIRNVFYGCDRRWAKKLKAKLDW